jgi:hypothetical protein
MKKMVNGIYVDMTASEIEQHQSDENIWNDGSFDRALHNLRIERNGLLAETDYLALSDQTLSADMNTYRQNLRDITNGLTTVEEVNAVVFPTKPTE